MYSSPTGSGHSLAGSSSGQRVWTRSGFWKSEAILASTLRQETPTFTVKPKRSRTASLMQKAAARASCLSGHRSVTSRKHSSMLSCSSRKV